MMLTAKDRARPTEGCKTDYHDAKAAEPEPLLDQKGTSTMNTEQIATILDAAILSVAQRQGVKPREVATKAHPGDVGEGLRHRNAINRR